MSCLAHLLAPELIVEQNRDHILLPCMPCSSINVESRGSFCYATARPMHACDVAIGSMCTSRSLGYMYTAHIIIGAGGLPQLRQPEHRRSATHCQLGLGVGCQPRAFRESALWRASSSERPLPRTARAFGFTSASPIQAGAGAGTWPPGDQGAARCVGLDSNGIQGRKWGTGCRPRVCPDFNKRTPMGLALVRGLPVPKSASTTARINTSSPWPVPPKGGAI